MGGAAAEAADVGAWLRVSSTTLFTSFMLYIVYDISNNPPYLLCPTKVV